MSVDQRQSRVDAYARGVAAAEARFGDECRHFDRAIWGMAEVMRAHGRNMGEHRIDNPVFGNFVTRWHNPLAMANEASSYEQWERAFPLTYAGIKKTYEERKLHGSYIPTPLVDAATPYPWEATWAQELLARETKELLDREIKRAFPGVRRGSKRYRELADSRYALAESLVKKEFEARQSVAAAKLVAWYLTEFQPYLAELRCAAGGYLERGRDLHVLNPACVVAQEYLTHGITLLQRIDGADEYVQKLLRDLNIRIGVPEPEEACA